MEDIPPPRSATHVVMGFSVRTRIPRLSAGTMYAWCVASTVVTTRTSSFSLSSMVSKSACCQCPAPREERIADGGRARRPGRHECVTLPMCSLTRLSPRINSRHRTPSPAPAPAPQATDYARPCAPRSYHTARRRCCRGARRWRSCTAVAVRVRQKIPPGQATPVESSGDGGESPKSPSPCSIPFSGCR